MKSYTQFDLELPIGRVHAVRNNTHASTRVLCIHGWLDNCASFLPMLPYLEDVECVAVDMAGHGNSAHRDRNSLYHYIDYVRDISFILDALQWEQCHLLGHSMGASISLMTANAFADRVQSLTMIDSLHPQTRAPEEGPAMLRRSLHQFTHWNPQRKKTFPSLDKAVDARLAASPYPQSKASARLIMDYATAETDQGYTLLSDARLNFRSPLMLCRTQIEAFIQTVEQPVMSILATHGIVQNRQDIDQTIELFQNISTKYIEGGHHVHMEKPQEVAACFLPFVQQHQVACTG